MFRDQFVYVDAHVNCPEKDYRTKWHRIKLTNAYAYLDLQEKTARTKGVKEIHKFCSVTLHIDPARKPEEEAWGPVFFDLDFDHDKTGKLDLDNARLDAIKLIGHFQNLGVPDHAIQVAFSGKKGFHILIEPEIFDIRPSKMHIKIIGVIAKQIKHQLGLNTMDDSIYSQARVWRVLNTKHIGSGLYKIPLYLSELLQPITEIQALAKTPREDFERDRSPVTPVLADMYTLAMDQIANLETIELSRPRKPMCTVDPGDPGPVCVRNLRQKNIRLKGTGNMARLVLATYCKDSGMKKEEAQGIVEELAITQPSHLSNDTVPGRLANARSVVESVYAAPEKYHFLCPAIRGLGNGAEEPIPCEWGKCKYVKQQDQEPAGILKLHTDQINRAEFAGKRFESRAQVAGVRDVPYIVPSKFAVSCSPNGKDGSPCMYCAIYQDQSETKGADGQARTERPVSLKEPALLAICGQPQGGVNKVLQRICGIPEACKRHRIEMTEKVNVFETELVPPVDLTNVDTDHTRLYSFIIAPKVELQENSIIQGYTHPHPKTGKATQIIDSMVPDKQSFQAVFTPEEIDALKIFQGNPFSKIPEIIKDWSDNILWVWNRDDVIVAVGLVLHSALFFHFQQGVVDRGWLETAIIGDSGQAKTKVVKGLFDHFRIGKIIGCGTLSEAGLIGGVKDMAGGHSFLNWGDLPRMDKSIVALDEAQEMADTIINKLKEIRDTGVASITKIESGRRMARVRQLYLANPRRNMSQYYYGCEALKDIFKRPADLRRLDFAMTVCREEIESGVYNKTHSSEKDPVYTSGLCNLLLRWIYTRRADQVVIPQDVQNKILKAADTLATKFGCDIQLCEASDLRFKLARISVSIAGWVFSSEDGMNLMVKHEHVDFAVDFLSRIYTQKYMSLDRYADIYSKMVRIDPKRLAALSEFFVKEVREKATVFIKLSTSSRWFTMTDLSEQMNMDRDQARHIVTFMSEQGLLTKKTNGYELTPVGIEFIKEWSSSHGYNEDYKPPVVDFDKIVEGRYEREQEGGPDQKDAGQPFRESGRDLQGRPMGLFTEEPTESE